MTTSLPANVHVSKHPCLLVKLSQLRSASTTSKSVKALVHEIALILGCEALASVAEAVPGTSDQTPLAFPYPTTMICPQSISLVPILRSGLAMVEALQTVLPEACPVHHLGLYREPTTLEPVEYYNNLPDHHRLHEEGSPASTVAVVLDPVIATGGTCAAAIQTLREWGARRVVVLSVLGAREGVARAAGEWPEGTEIWMAGLDGELTDRGMLRPGLGDVGDRLFLTIGK